MILLIKNFFFKLNKFIFIRYDAKIPRSRSRTIPNPFSSSNLQNKQVETVAFGPFQQFKVSLET